MNKFIFIAATLLMSIAAQANDEACINLYPRHVIAQCQRSSFVMDVGHSIVSTLEVRQAMWQQNPASSKNCRLSPFSGVEISYNLSEVSGLDRVSPMSLPDFSGFTQNNTTMTFARPIFSGVLRMVGNNGSSFGTVDKTAKSVPGFHKADFVLSRYGTVLTGEVTSADGKYAAWLSALSFECEFF